ncbi:MAG: hypothetical protein DI533_04685 [Cereibacter sphaeroides]|uniref:Uncharacterized protein n=1 Tax=Cereibacter sphaeroides TaxID=1063 RepID=A0A2W5SA77_CERSP|nr:MAG: hypothetical protein DI533_04685 [Cereibacter sphaeroides]
MAIVTGKSDLIVDPRLGETAVDPVRARGRPIIATGTVANLSTDNANSKYLLAKIPSHAMLGAGTFFAATAWGFATVNIGTKTAPTALFTGLRATGLLKPVVEGDAKHGKELWEILGLAADPGGDIELWAHGPADATTAGSAKFEIHYRAR